MTGNNDNLAKMSEKNENIEDKAGTSKQKKQNSDDKFYEGIRGHERHILFHFFTLFSISFFIGVVFIHLSLWMNANLINPNQESTTTETENPNKNIPDRPIWLEPLLQYTGNYFINLTINGTTLHSF